MDRAGLDGLESVPSHLEEWLAAGGERRRRPRPTKVVDLQLDLDAPDLSEG